MPYSFYEFNAVVISVINVGHLSGKSILAIIVMALVYCLTIFWCSVAYIICTIFSLTKALSPSLIMIQSKP
jgi:hypothetical protein